ncbi:MAG: hypothetical protein GXO80_06760 [Chlorobi bacterium]|nr:hypothetical protein [Chlorobiota bacterium]
MKIHLYNLLLSFLILLNNNLFSQPVEIPVIDYVTVNQAASLPVIHWSVSTPSAVNGYSIKRLIRSYPTVPDNTWHTIKRIDNPNVFNFQDNSITYGAAKPNLYSEIYEVTAYKINGSDTTYSLPSEKHKTIFLDGSYEYCSNSMALIWNNYIGWNSDFKQYEIYCKENNSSFTKIAETNYNDTSFIHSNLNYHSTYTYYIKAIRNDGIESVSNLKPITVTTINLPTFLRIDSVTADNSEIHISFDYDKSADTENFILYKSHSKNKDYILSETIKDSGNVNFEFTDTNFDKNNLVYYYIAATDYCGKSVINSDTVSNIVLSAETNLINERSNKLQWKDMYQDSVYKIYRSVSGNDFELIEESENNFYNDNIQDIFENQFSTNTTSGKFYYYVLINSDDFYNHSNIVCAEQKETVIFPNAFNPKSNIEENRIFKPKSAFISDYQLTIYGSFGDIIFESKNPDYGWNGTLKNGKLAPVSSYLYFVRYKNASGNLIKYKNYITLVY